MTNTIYQSFPFDDGEVRVEIRRESPIPGWFFANMVGMMTEARTLAETLPVKSDKKNPDPLEEL